MKTLKILAITGNLAMFIGCVFEIINLSLEKGIFPYFITIPLMLLGVIGNIAFLFKDRIKK